MPNRLPGTCVEILQCGKGRSLLASDFHPERFPDVERTLPRHCNTAHTKAACRSGTMPGSHDSTSSKDLGRSKRRRNLAAGIARWGDVQHFIQPPALPIIAAGVMAARALVNPAVVGAMVPVVGDGAKNRAITSLVLKHRRHVLPQRAGAKNSNRPHIRWCIFEARRRFDGCKCGWNTSKSCRTINAAS